MGSYHVDQDRNTTLLSCVHVLCKVNGGSLTVLLFQGSNNMSQLIDRNTEIYSTYREVLKAILIGTKECTSIESSLHCKSI